MSHQKTSVPGLRWVSKAIVNGATNLRRNLFLSIATILVISLMLFVFNLVLALNFASESVVDEVGRKFDIRVEILEGVEDYSIQSFVNEIKREEGVEEVIHISKTDALEKLQERYPAIVSFVNYNELGNPLPDVVQIITQNVSFNNQIIQYLENPKFSQILDQLKLENNVEQKDRNEKILNVTQLIQKISFWLILIFIFVGLAIIFNSININIHSHQKEISIMKLVGAKYWFIRLSYIFEGLFFALAALFISLIFSQVVLIYLGQNLLDIISNDTLLKGIDAIFLHFHFKENLWLTFIWQLVAMLAVGFLSSYLAIELYLRKNSA